MQNDIISKIKSYIDDNKLIQNGDTCIIGVSGGADSVCLLNVLSSLKDVYGINLVVVHVNHCIRGAEADGDENYVRQLCDTMQIPFIIYKRDIPAICAKTKETEEECGRRIRYEVFDEVASLYNDAKIVVAHHMNDQAETIIFRIARGTGVKGLAGMKPRFGQIIRPLLCVSRDEIIDYLNNIDLSYRTDSTNEDVLYSRNYIRKELIPDFERINPAFIQHISSLSKEAMEVEEYLNEEADELLNRSFDNAIKSGNAGSIYNKYDVNPFSEVKPIIRRIAIRRLIEKSGISLKDITRDHILQIEKLLPARESSRVCLPKKVIVVIEGGYLYVDKDGNSEDIANQEDFCQMVEENSIYRLPDGSLLKTRLLSDFDQGCIPTNPYTKWFDYDKIKSGLCIRNRLPGDYLVVNEAGDHKKLKEYMINEKIPKSDRDRIPLLADESRIIWVIGHRISADAKVTDNTTTVFECTIEKEN